MLLLTGHEEQEWRALAADALAAKSGPDKFKAGVRSNLAPMFYFYLGSLMAAKGMVDLGREWLAAGALSEEDTLMSNAYLSSFIERQGGKLIMPAVVFADPQPYIHFTGVPAVRAARLNFLRHCAHSLPEFKRPARILDIGCGDGALTAQFIRTMRAAGKIGDVGELTLIDRSPAMLALAKETVASEVGRGAVRSAVGRIEDLAAGLEGHYDVALSALAFHHMPLEQKRVHLDALKGKMDNFIIFEIDANNDLPGQHSPALAVSVYQSYGRLINLVFTHDAPVALALSCVDAFLMTEEISFLIQPRGERNDYHMLKTQWHDLFEETLAPSMTCLCDSACYADEYTGLFTLHYGR